MMVWGTVAIGATVALVLLAVRGDSLRAWIAGVAGACQALALGLAAAGVLPVQAPDPLGRVAALGLGLAWFAAALASPPYYLGLVERGSIKGSDLTRTLVLTQLFATALTVVTMSADLTLSWVMVEVTTITGAFLVGFDGSARRLEAAWKFAVLCFAGVGFGLVGIGLLVASQGDGPTSTSFAALAAHAKDFDPALVKLAFAALVAAFGTKAGFVPLHWWLPDAHAQSPTPVSALMSGGLVATALVVLVQTRSALAPALGGSAFSAVFIALGIAGLVLSTLSMVMQRDLKRLLAYSTIEHIALMAIAVGIGTPLALVALAVHLAGHAALKAAAFLGAGGLAESAGSTQIDQLSGSISRDRANSTLILVASAGLLGVPPSPLFASELILLLAAAQAHMLWLAILIVVLLAVAFAAFGERILAATLGKGHEAKEASLGLFYALPSAIVLVWTGSLLLAQPEWVRRLLAATAVAMTGRAPW